MKRTVYLYLTVLSLLFACLPSNAQQAFYIYRNDGVINTFFTTEIDSMTYSSLDVDSIEHSDFVVQEVYTPDSIYRIPIEKIDSVGFITPETKYQPGVTVLEGDLRSYIVSRDNLTLTFSSDIPNSLLPRKGDKLVSTVGDEYLQSAFVGQVAEIHNGASGVEVVCEPVDLLDVFECYYGIPAVKPQTRGIIDGTYTTGTQTFSPGKLKFKALDNHDFQFAYNPNDELSFSIDKAKVEASVTPTITYNSVIVINKHYGINVSVTAISDLTFEQYAELCGSVTYNKDISLLKPVIPLPEALVDIYFELGVFWNVSGTLATEQLCRQNIKHVFHWDWSSRGHEVLQNVNKIYQKENSHQGKVALSGSVSAGGYGKVAVAFITQSIGLDIAEVGVRVEGGMRCEGTYVPYKEDKEYAKTSTDLYNQIKDQRVPLTLFYTSKAEAKLAKWSVNYDIPNIFKMAL